MSFGACAERCSVLVGHHEFDHIVVADSEYFQPRGERPGPKYLVWRELGSGRLHHLYGADLLSRNHPPYPIGPNSLFVAFYAPAEINCHLALGWPVPANVYDRFVEFRNLTNGRRLPHGVRAARRPSILRPTGHGRQYERRDA